MDIKTLITKQKSFYQSIVSVYCPILNDTVYFTSEGFHHLLYESNRRPRKIAEQYMKLRCLDHVVKAVSGAYFSETRKLSRKIKGVEKEVTQYGLVCQVKKDVLIRVVVQRVGKGRAHFLSIMPHNEKSKQKPKKRQ